MKKNNHRAIISGIVISAALFAGVAFSVNAELRLVNDSFKNPRTEELKKIEAEPVIRVWETTYQNTTTVPILEKAVQEETQQTIDPADSTQANQPEIAPVSGGGQTYLLEENKKEEIEKKEKKDNPKEDFGLLRLDETKSDIDLLEILSSKASKLFSEIASLVQTLESDDITSSEDDLEFVFNFPKRQSILSEDVLIKGKIESEISVNGVSYYAIEKNMPNEPLHFLGKAEAREGMWELRWKTSEFNNGNYDLYARFVGESKEWKSQFLPVEIKNTEKRNGDSEAQTISEYEKQTESGVKEDDSKKVVAESSLKEIRESKKKIENVDEIRKHLEEKEIKTPQIGISFNPLIPEAIEKVNFEDPRSNGIKSDVLRVENVSLAIVDKEPVSVMLSATSSSTGASSPNGINKKEVLRISGKAPAYALVVIYIYSEVPTIVTVVADENGNWSYELEKTLDSGNHEAYVTITDNTGKVIAKSETFRFIKEAQAVSVIDANAKEISTKDIQNAEIPRKSFLENNFKALIFSIIGIALIMAVFFVIRAFKKSTKNVF